MAAEEKAYKRHHSLKEAEDDRNPKPYAAVHPGKADADSCRKVRQTQSQGHQDDPGHRTNLNNGSKRAVDPTW